MPDGAAVIRGDGGGGPRGVTPAGGPDRPRAGPDPAGHRDAGPGRGDPRRRTWCRAGPRRPATPNAGAPVAAGWHRRVPPSRRAAGPPRPPCPRGPVSAPQGEFRFPVRVARDVSQHGGEGRRPYGQARPTLLDGDGERLPRAVAHG